MTDPAAFAEARLAEDEAAAKAAWPGPWDLETEVGGFGPVAYVLMPLGGHEGARTGLTRYMPLGMQDADTAAHIALHDPARALREVEAGRRILARHWNCGTGGGWCDEPGLTRGSPCPDMTDLLTRWADHPAYDQEWKP